MAGALVGTFYGAFVANMVMLPMAGKLDIRAKQEYQMRELMIEGIVAIQSGEKPGRGVFTRAPKLGDVPYPVQMEPNLVVEFYSR